MLRIRLAIATIALAGVPAIAQLEATTANIQPKFPTKPAIMRSIDAHEAAAHQAQAANASNESIAKIYRNLGTLYESVDMYPKAEDSLSHAVALLRTGPQDQLADVIGLLATLHSTMNETRKAESEHREALKIRETIGSPLGIAESQNDLAAVYVRERHYKQAMDYATKAEAAIANDLKAPPDSRIAVRETLANALCGLHQCERAIPLLQDAIQLSRESFGDDSLSVGIASYLLGYAEWHNGNQLLAEELMKRGTDRMKVGFGFGHMVYAGAMEQYAKLLQERGEVEAASAVQRELRQVADVVDARSFTARP
jgi:tetratricopeptide (TPR) repeat protein